MTGFADRRLNRLGYACDKSGASCGNRTRASALATQRHPPRPTKPEERLGEMETRRRGEITRSPLSPRRPASVSPSSGAGERIRTFIKLGLSQSPLPIGPRQRTSMSNRELPLRNDSETAILHSVPSGRFELTTVQFLRLATPTSWSTRAYLWTAARAVCTPPSLSIPKRQSKRCANYARCSPTRGGGETRTHNGEAATRVRAVLFIQPDRLQTMRAGFEPASDLAETP